jgi:TonB family protein
MTDSESDPFAVVGSAEFRQGSVKARFGRKVTTVRPRLSLAGRQDLLIVEQPRVILRVRVDETGAVRDVKVVASSGSNEIDQPCVLAMYEWWFEPLRDKSGKPMPAEMIWTLSWRIR